MQLSQKRIIVMEDDAALRSLYRRTFERWFDAAVETLEDPTLAVKKAIASPPDLFTTDIGHPGMPAQKMVAKLRGNPRTKDVPIWIISGQVDTPEGLAAVRQGADALIPKPFRFDELAERATRLFKSSSDPDALLVDLGCEDPGLDYKVMMDLSSKAGRASFAKDVIAFANSGGGKIIVGVKEARKGIFETVGIPDDFLEAYEVTRLNRAISDFIDPGYHVSSRIIVLKKRNFAVVTIPGITDAVLLARKEHTEAGLFCGRIYIRNHCAESAEARRSEEIRDILDRLRAQRKEH